MHLTEKEKIALVSGILLMTAGLCLSAYFSNLSFVDETGLLHENFAAIVSGELLAFAGAIVIICDIVLAFINKDTRHHKK